MNFMTFHSLLLPQIFIAYAVLFSICGIHMIAIFLTSALLIALQMYKLPKGDQESADNILKPHKVCIIAHRGAGDEAPENTLAAIKEAKKNGADGVEFDVEYTMDGEAVLLHDSEVDRTTDGRGAIGRMSLIQARKLNATAKHPLKEQFGFEQIPTLEEAVTLCLELGLTMYIDVKENPQKSAEVLSALYKKYPDMYKNALVCSFHPDVVYMIRRADPGIITALIHRHNFLHCTGEGVKYDLPGWRKVVYPVADILLEWAMYHWLWYLCGTSAFSVNCKEVSRRMIDHFAERGIQVIVWTSNNVQEKDFLTHHLKCSYITDTLVTENSGKKNQ